MAATNIPFEKPTLAEFALAIISLLAIRGTNRFVTVELHRAFAACYKKFEAQFPVPMVFGEEGHGAYYSKRLESALNASSSCLALDVHNRVSMTPQAAARSLAKLREKFGNDYINSLDELVDKFAYEYIRRRTRFH